VGWLKPSLAVLIDPALVFQPRIAGTICLVVSDLRVPQELKPGDCPDVSIMEKEDARYQTLEQLHERRKQAVSLHKKGI